jgi:hypothetical protein
VLAERRAMVPYSPPASGQWWSPRRRWRAEAPALRARTQSPLPITPFLPRLACHSDLKKVGPEDTRKGEAAGSSRELVSFVTVLYATARLRTPLFFIRLPLKAHSALQRPAHTTPLVGPIVGSGACSQAIARCGLRLSGFTESIIMQRTDVDATAAYKCQAMLTILG